jgi:hypothetical protein
VPFIKIKRSNPNITDRVVLILGTLLMLGCQNNLTVLAQPAPALVIDRIFRYNSTPPGSDNQTTSSLVSLKKWMGSYQRTLGEGTNYVAIFDRGSVPLTIELKDSGDIKSVVFGCPVAKSLSLSDAPADLQKLWIKCR